MGHIYRTNFQFHLVRLKDYIGKNVAQIPPTFQFHLVRLKDLFTWKLQSFPSLSIPFSTIKRIHSLYVQHYIYFFQFHLVRLKVNTAAFARTRQYFFQFHLVRLKEYN